MKGEMVRSQKRRHYKIVNKRRFFSFIASLIVAGILITYASSKALSKKKVEYPLAGELMEDSIDYSDPIIEEVIIKGSIPGRIKSNDNKSQKLKGSKIDKKEVNIPGGKINIKDSNMMKNEYEYDPLTLRGLFNGDVNSKIILNQPDIKSSEIKIDNISGYINGKNPSENIEIEVSNINKKGPQLRSNKKDLRSINFSGESIEGNISGKGKSINFNVPNLNAQSMISYNEPKTIKDLFSGDVNETIKLKVKNYKIEKNNSESISGIIKGSKNDKNDKISLQTNPNKQSHKISQLKRSERLNFIEYGATQGYKRPNIRKGIDFEHKPRVNFDKYDSNSSINIFSKPFVVDDKKISASTKIKFK